ncbi:MAG TPA: hypothetical protein VHE61_10230, partial [Opitutaceae bacterium]|nr:hypothetical protein [Opitutaceae bacterium]
MTAAVRHQLRRTERVALGVGIIALLVAIVFAFLSPRSLAPAWRLAVFACLAPAIGSLIFILIFRTTSGQWVEGLAPFLLAGARLLPWAWLLIIPLLWVPVAAVPHDMRPQVPQLERDHTVVGGGMDARTAYEHVFS